VVFSNEVCRTFTAMSSGTLLSTPFFRKLLHVVVKIHLVQRFNHCNMLMNFRIPEKTETLLSIWTTLGL
jgi:hypothetical protein